MRRVRKLEYACLAESSPPKARIKKNLKASQADGLRFEKKSLDKIENSGLELERGRWIKFRDADGDGMAQPDAFACLNKRRILILECKRTQKDSAWSQMQDLYAPLLVKVFPETKDFCFVQVCKVRRNCEIEAKKIKLEALPNLTPGQYLLHLPLL